MTADNTAITVNGHSLEVVMELIFGCANNWRCWLQQRDKAETWYSNSDHGRTYFRYGETSIL